MKYYILYKELRIGEYELIPMAGCKAIGISCHLQIYPEFRGQGYGTGAHRARLEHARQVGFAMLIATTDSTNKPQDIILQRYKWKRCREFMNHKTGHTVTLWCHYLYDPYEFLGGV